MFCSLSNRRDSRLLSARRFLSKSQVASRLSNCFFFLFNNTLVVHITVQCILPQGQTTPEKCLSNPWYGKGFCEPGQYKVAIDRCEGGFKSCELSMDIFKDLVKVLENCSQAIRHWSKTSQRQIIQSKESGTNRTAWINSIRAVEKLAERNEDIMTNIQKNVLDKMAAHKNSKYEKTFIHVKKIKEFEKEFKKIQKPWLELSSKLDEAKQSYEHANYKLRQAKRLQYILESDVGTSIESKQKVKYSIANYEAETNANKIKYKKLSRDINEKQSTYEGEMFNVLARMDDFERDRLNHFKATLIALQKATSIENDTRHVEMFNAFEKAINGHSTDSDIEFFNEHYGRETKTKWPVVEDFDE